MDKWHEQWWRAHKEIFKNSKGGEQQAINITYTKDTSNQWKNDT